MDYILREPIEGYLLARQQSFADNKLASKFRHTFPKELEKILQDTNRYKTAGSPGSGQWADCPWIAILDTLVTESAQRGYYLVFLFRSDMSGVFLSLNQGVTDIRKRYGRGTREELRLRAQGFRSNLDYDSPYFINQIDLRSSKGLAKDYEAGNILARFYDRHQIPETSVLIDDILLFLRLYKKLVSQDQVFTDIEATRLNEKIDYSLHWKIERNARLSKEVKKKKGYTCEACGMDFVSRYGQLGREFIEAHHLIPISTLEKGSYNINIERDFAVLCSNCHSMIHRLDDPSDLNKLRQTILSTN